MFTSSFKIPQKTHWLTCPTSWDLSPSIKTETIESPSIKKWLDNYLWAGEWVMDQSVAVMASTSYFERKR
jgi:hypothetical protein